MKYNISIIIIEKYFFVCLKGQMMKFLNLLILLVISLGLTAALAGCQFQNKGGDEADEHREGARVESSEHRESSEGVSEHQESREEVGEHREAGEEHAEEGE